MKIVFNNPFFFKDSLKYIRQIINKKYRNTTSDFFYEKTSKFLEKKLKVNKIFITNSATSSLEIAAILIGVKKNDEIIMPSYTFVSTANAFVLRGAKPVFVDIKKNTLNINEDLIEKSITKNTKAIVVVHYAGISCEMNKIVKIARKYNLYVIEDAAQALFSKYKKKYCGTIGDIGCFSFHETKNFTSGEGGALAINNKKFIKKASVIVNKGTDREFFYKNLKKFYSWKGVGSSYKPSEFTCAILFSQIKKFKYILNKRKQIWLSYKNNLKNLNSNIIIDQIKEQKKTTQNYHMYYLIAKNNKIRNKIIEEMKKFKIHLSFHYIPLHESTMGKKYKKSSLKETEKISKTIIRLPVWIGVKQTKVINKLKKVINIIFIKKIL